ncbi:hypothetical protein AAFF_G00346290 [Aldrovandia affinis]|uniref:Uncharacterized protein n=1 Tax=Aldrovandia affinis TaxID=143900 RepID=A0AAD7SLQ6_9TELE|nr:hypothetical protein AAFF_G00346290 [Aldrovandia affinis]
MHHAAISAPQDLVEVPGDWRAKQGRQRRLVLGYGAGLLGTASKGKAVGAISSRWHLRPPAPLPRERDRQISTQISTHPHPPFQQFTTTEGRGVERRESVSGGYQRKVRRSVNRTPDRDAAFAPESSVKCIAQPSRRSARRSTPASAALQSRPQGHSDWQDLLSSALLRCVLKCLPSNGVQRTHALYGHLMFIARTVRRSKHRRPSPRL